MTLPQVQPERIGPEYLGILLPLIIFLVAFLAAYLLYRHFAQK